MSSVLGVLTAQKTLKQLQKAGDKAWDDIKPGLEKSWTERLEA